MAKNKTTETESSVANFINTLTDEVKKDDCFKLIAMMESETGLPAKMWGPAIVGFGSYHYKYESGREGDAPMVAFSPRKAAITLYLSSVFENRDEFLQKLGKYKAEGGCVYIKKLADVDAGILKVMIKGAFEHAKSKYSA
jgi:hypothetical protein